MKPKKQESGQKRGEQIGEFIEHQYEVTLPEQVTLVNRLVEFSEEENARFTTEGLDYIMEEIRDREAIGDLTREDVTDALNRILDEFVKWRRMQRVIGRKTLKSIVSMIGCPKPWC